MRRKAYLAGLAFYLGVWYGQHKSNLTQDALIFRTLKNGVKIAIKDSEVVGGAGYAVGPDKLPTFDNYANQERFKDASPRKIATKYMQEHYQNGIKEVKLHTKLKFNGVEVSKVVFTGNSCRETSAKINQDKLKILPYIADIYRTGTFSAAQTDVKAEKHKDDKRSYVYTSKIIKIDGKTYNVLLVSRLIPRQDLQHYAIGKADLAKDTLQYSYLELKDIKVK